MDESNPIQNPNVAPPLVGGQGPMMDHITKKKSHWALVSVVIVLVVVFFVAWWYVNQMSFKLIPVVQQPATNQEAREDIMINNEIQAADSTDIDSEFKEVDTDINSL